MQQLLVKITPVLEKLAQNFGASPEEVADMGFHVEGGCECG